MKKAMPTNLLMILCAVTFSTACETKSSVRESSEGNPSEENSSESNGDLSFRISENPMTDSAGNSYTIFLETNDDSVQLSSAPVQNALELMMKPESGDDACEIARSVFNDEIIFTAEFFDESIESLEPGIYPVCNAGDGCGVQALASSINYDCSDPGNYILSARILSTLDLTDDSFIEITGNDGVTLKGRVYLASPITEQIGVSVDLLDNAEIREFRAEFEAENNN